MNISRVNKVLRVNRHVSLDVIPSEVMDMPCVYAYNWVFLIPFSMYHMVIEFHDQRPKMNVCMGLCLTHLQFLNIKPYGEGVKSIKSFLIHFLWETGKSWDWRIRMGRQTCWDKCLNAYGEYFESMLHS